MKRRKQISADELRFGCQRSNLKVMGGAQTILCPNAQSFPRKSMNNL